jgi:hypothetical protein
LITSGDPDAYYLVGHPAGEKFVEKMPRGEKWEGWRLSYVQQAYRSLIADGHKRPEGED